MISVKQSHLLKLKRGRGGQVIEVLPGDVELSIDKVELERTFGQSDGYECEQTLDWARAG